MTNKPRQPLIALFAGLVLPGLGQVYCGDGPRGVAFLLGFALLLPGAAWLAVHGPTALLSWLVLAGVLAALAVYVASVVDAYRTARRLGASFAPGPWNRGVVYFAMFLLGYFFVLSPLADHTTSHLVQTFKVPSPSMMPTIMPGARFFADKRVGHVGGPKVRRGEIAVFVYPNDRTTMYVKRIIGLPGDRIEIDGNDIKVNGTGLRQEELHQLGSPGRDRLLDQNLAFRESVDGTNYAVLWRKDAPPAQLNLTVPNGQVFVLGDNRSTSQDSRHFGTLPLADVTGIARQISDGL
jgi:signal peptidase I